MSTSSFLLNSLTFFGWLRRQQALGCGGAAADGAAAGGHGWRAGGHGALVVAVALVIGVGHVNDLADGGKVGFSVAQQAESTAPEIGEDSFGGDFDFQFVRGHLTFG